MDEIIRLSKEARASLPPAGEIASVTKETDRFGFTISRFTESYTLELNVKFTSRKYYQVLTREQFDKEFAETVIAIIGMAMIDE